MKDSQLSDAQESLGPKYIKESNERFSTTWQEGEAGV